ncbi:MAG: polyprenyl synthetase family protein [Bifidobacterium sp.]|uniref:Polyprenyl synthetase family protein n=1 Tax=Bifidobacterium fermentum TaxID=3059035 RepID=A0AB39UP69_9BIFI
MTIPEDIPAINHRIESLVGTHLAAPAGTHIPQSCSPIYRTVQDQGIISNEGGKRLRARLLLTIYDAIQGDRSNDRSNVMDLACAVEVFQTAALVHDDIIDNSDLRRGRPSAHVALAAALGQLTGHSDDDALPSAVGHITHIGAGLGIMLGDLLSTASIGIVNETVSKLEHSEGILQAFLRMHREVEIGQVLDLAVERVPLDEPGRLAEASLAVFRWKTASYTTVAPLTLGMLAAGIQPCIGSDSPSHAGEGTDMAEAIGSRLGTAFQLADDLLDVIGEPERIGKPTGGDIREGKRTVLLADALTMADRTDREYLAKVFAAETRDGNDVERITRIFDESGAIDKSRRRISQLWSDVRGSIELTAQALRMSDDSRDSVVRCCSLFIPQTLR